MYLVVMGTSFFARSMSQVTHSMNVCPAMQRCMQSCYVCLIVASATGVPWQNQHLQSAAPCVSATQDDAFKR